MCIRDRSVNVAKDVAWNRRLIANQITQGVLLGESIPKIAKRRVYHEWQEVVDHTEYQSSFAQRQVEEIKQCHRGKCTYQDVHHIGRMNSTTMVWEVLKRF